jgi:hypothetical protein
VTHPLSQYSGFGTTSGQFGHHVRVVEYERYFDCMRRLQLAFQNGSLPRKVICLHISLTQSRPALRGLHYGSAVLKLAKRQDERGAVE